MRKVLVLLSVISVMCMMILAGCGEKKTTDQAFVEDMQAGLEARWTLADKNDADKKKEWEKLINAELEKIEKYKKEKFEDKELGKLAKEYIGLLNDSKDSLSYFGNDDKFSAKNDEIYNNRAVVIYKLNKDYKLTVDEAHQEELDEFVDLGKIVLDVRAILDKTEFKLKKNEYGWKDYEAVVENTSDTDFKYFAYNINLNDKDDVTVETPTSSTDNWKAGTKHRFEFSTDKKFKKIDIVSANWDY